MSIGWKGTAEGSLEDPIDDEMLVVVVIVIVVDELVDGLDWMWLDGLVLDGLVVERFVVAIVTAISTIVPLLLHHLLLLPLHCHSPHGCSHIHLPLLPLLLL